jgi:hypothetical protein
MTGLYSTSWDPITIGLEQSRVWNMQEWPGGNQIQSAAPVIEGPATERVAITI